MELDDAIHTAILTLKEGYLISILFLPLWLVTLWTSSLTELWACRYEGQISSSNIEIGIIRPDREFRYDIWKHSLTPFAYVEDPTSIPLALCGCFYIFVSALCFDHIPLCLLSSCSLSNRQNIYLVAKYSFMYRFLCILIEFIRQAYSQFCAAALVGCSGHVIAQ